MEILNTQIIRSRSQIYGEGENPINRKGILSACNDGDEEIVKTNMKVLEVKMHIIILF